MIPKIIHYCWLSGDAYPDNIQKCIDSWKEKLPDYEIMLWNRERSMKCGSQWLSEAYAQRKYAFAADYIRFYALYHYGGIYLDSDVEVLKNFDDLLHLPYFIGFDSFGYFEAAVVGSEPNNSWIKLCLDYYTNRHFLLQSGTLDTTPLPKIMYKSIGEKYKITPICAEKSTYVLDDALYVFPYMYFSPKRHDTGLIRQANYTYTIHHYSMSWIPLYIRVLVQLKRTLIKTIGVRNTEKIISFFSLREWKNWMISKKGK